MASGRRSVGAGAAGVAALLVALLCLPDWGLAASFAAVSSPVRAAGEEFDLPADDDEVVVRLVENRGPISPDAQEGYKIEITAGGEAIYTITPVGSSPDLGRDADEQIVVTADLSDDDLQDLLAELDERGFFALAEEADPDDDRPTGGSISLLAVTLEDGELPVYEDGLSADDRAVLVDAQQAVVAAVLVAAGEAAVEAGTAFDLPDEGEIVVRSRVDNGPLEPEYQMWYEIEIDAAGRAEAEFSPEGAHPDLDEPSAEPEGWSYDLGEDGLQGLLVVLDALGYFELPSADDVEMPDGAGADHVEVSLAGESWEVYGGGLRGARRARFDAIQTAIAAAAGLDQFPTPLF